MPDHLSDGPGAANATDAVSSRLRDKPSPGFRPLESITILAVIGVLALALGVVALTRPATAVESRKLAYQQSGTFSYSAKAPKSSVYGAGGLTTGQPILTNVVDPVHAAFAYTLTSAEPATLHGTASLDLIVDLGHGLTRSFPVAPARSFTGQRVGITGTLPLAQVRTFVNTAGRTVGGLPLGGATVTLRPHITVEGTIGGHALERTSYTPALAFTLDGSTLSPVGTSGAGTGGGSTDGSDPLHPSSTEALSYSATAPNTVPLLIIHPPVIATRLVAFALAAVCLLLCLWFARPLRSGRSVGDRDRIEALYGGQLVRVTEIGPHTGPVADVSSLDALVGLAKKYESMIMQLTEPEADTYLVWDNGMMFRYRIDHPPGEDEHSLSEDPPAEAPLSGDRPGDGDAATLRPPAQGPWTTAARSPAAPEHPEHGTGRSGSEGLVATPISRSRGGYVVRPAADVELRVSSIP